MSENHVAEQLREPDSDPGHEIGYTQSNGVSESTTEEDATASMNQIEHVDPNDAVLGDPAEDGKSTEDNMFVDCPDELITFDGRQGDNKEEAASSENEENKSEDDPVLHQQSGFVEPRNGVVDGYPNGELEQLCHKLEKAVAEKESIVQKYQEERGTDAQGMLDLHFQLKALTGEQLLLDEAEVGVREVADVPIKKMIKECLEFVKTASEERLKSEATISNFHEFLSMKDREIEDLNTKVAQLMASNESLHVSSETQLEKDRNIEIAIDKTISSLATVVNQEQVLDNSISGRIVYIEEGTALLIEKYNQILSEIYQLGQTLSEVGLDAREQEHGNILADARGGLLELKRKETELVEKLGQLEDENQKLVEELDKERAMIGTLNTELGNMKTELEQEKVKSTNAKEKLSMAVTKGKALVQQRDSLKNSLADKSSELEKCLIELQEKKVALEAAEITKEEFTRSENMVASLQSSLLQSNKIFEQVEEILSHAEPDQPEISDIPERLRWLVEDRNMLKGSFQELCKLKDALSLVDLPEPVSSSDLESQMIWLRDSFHSARDDMYSLQEEISAIKEASRNYIDDLSISLMMELQEKDYLQSESTDLRFKYEELVGKNHQFSLEKDQIVKMLVDLSGLNLEDEGIDQSPSSTSTLIDLCFQVIKGQSGHFSRASHIEAELFERIQSLLYVRDLGLMLYEDILEEDMLIRSDVNKLSNELKVASEEIIALKEERSSLLKDLKSSDEKSAMLRDKLSMAVKKGKGLVQDRDNLKGLLNEKNSEIEQLKFDLQKQESEVSEYREQINRLSCDIESIPKLEADLLEMKRERNQFEQFLMDSNGILQRVMECIDGIVLPIDPVFGEPIEKVKWFAGYVSECQDAKVHVEQELQLVKEEASILEIKLAEAQATVKSLEQGLSSSEDSVSQLAEERTELEHEKARVEEELQKVKEKIAEVCSTTKSLEVALSQAEKDISVLSNEKEQAQVGRVAAEAELERAKEEAARQSSKLEEASRTIKDLADKLSQVESNVNLHVEQEVQLVKEEASILEIKLAEAQATVKSLEQGLSSSEDSVSQLAEERTELEHEKARVEEELQKVKEKVAEVCSTTKSLEDALSQAEEDISVLSNEKEQAQVGRVAAETGLERAKEEATRQSSKLEEANRTIKDLEDKLSQVESNVNLLTEKYNADQVVKTNMETELKKLLDEAANHASNLADAYATIKSLEDALLKAQDDISALEDANKIAKEEISSLGFKLNSCMDKLAGKSGSLENRSIELIGILNDLQVLMKDNTLFPRVKQCFERKCESLENMSLILNKIGDHIVAMTNGSEGHLTTEEDPLVRKAFLDDFENFEVELDNRDINGTDIDTIISSFGKILKGFQLRNKHIADKFDEFSNSVDEIISPLREKLLETETNIMTIVEDLEIVKERANTMEKLKEEKENIIATLENDISVLRSACTDATSELQIEVDKNLGQLGSISEVEKLNLETDARAEHHKNSKYMEATQKLITASEKAQTLIRQFECRSELEAATIEDLQNKLEERTDAFELVIDERDLNKNRVLQLESNIQLLQSDCSELRNNLEGYHALEEKLKEKEEEISSMRSTLLAEEQEAESSPLSASQARDLFYKIDRIKIPIVESEEDDMELYTSNPAKKLFYIIDSVTRLHHQVNSLSHDKEELQLTLETKVLEIKDLKEEVKQLNRNLEDSKMIKNELFELAFALKQVMDIVGANDGVVDRKTTDVKELIPALEKHIEATLLESENSKSKAQELGIELVGRQKVIDELTTKVKLLEDSLRERISQPEIVQERSIFEAPSLPAGSEITEVEEGSLGKKVVPPVPSAAHVRNMRKGSSTEHLALDISGESDHLISSADTDDDKGHLFKSLNTSGFIPKQGKLIADRVDGFWVSGGRVLMSRPRARLGVIGYLLILHLWLLGTIL